MASVLQRKKKEVASEMWNEQLNLDNKAALLAWVKDTGVRLVQINGQRKYGGPPPGWFGRPTPSGTEVFIGKIPQDIYEDKLIPLFQSVGELYEFRLMMTFSGLNRGFAYAMYIDRDGAQKAIRLLNKYEIQKGHQILVSRSTNKCELCIDGLAPSVKEDQLLPMLQELTTGVISITIHPSPFKKQRQLAVVKYISHQAAAIAKKALVEGTLCLCGDQIEVDWLTPNIKNELQVSSGQAIPQIMPTRYTCRDVLIQDPPEPVNCHELPTLGSMLDYLNSLCEKKQLGYPEFFTKCVQKNPEGWLQVWYHVAIPRCTFPFNGFVWIKPDDSGLENDEKVKNVVALQILSALGCPVV
ncbi:dead end protein homolog 1 [Anolis carolinensis]|uniref:RRM domain-containing protein n=1 Tax=Anolis carolinensis TaxID=28377 RepID=G1KMZ1_ANOCA|nr:PREDICTED: dead end protein homolog 1 [Anolis carolinensis]|eukprot:XP_003220024.2 PREDICTED: dead end protein homolog 1 [Anolis carolinensis]